MSKRLWIGWLSGLACLSGCFPPALDKLPLPTLDQVILRPDPAVENTPASRGYAYDEVAVPLQDGRSVVLWHVHADAPKALVVILPGSDANKGLYVEGLPIFIPNGYDVVLMDYEGFGTSPGTRTLQACLDDAFAVVNYAQQQHAKVFVFGISIGTPLAVRVAAAAELQGVILEGTANLFNEAQLWLLQRNIDVPLFWHAANF